MTIYYLTTSQTYFKDYKVEADSEEEAANLVMTGLIDPYQEDWGGDWQVDNESIQTAEEEEN